ncbi:MAG TPA: hypothetical protein VK395_21850 [Gemmataceae bacterium]|nr:hypothetical protein [Gemmataceae bacterium]
MIQKLLYLALFVSLSSVLFYAAPQMADEKTSAAQTVTGCLQKGTESGGFFLISTEDKHWELYPNTDVSLADHVGHTITVTGTLAHRSKAQEEKSQPSEQKEIGGKKHNDLQVSSVKMVSATCSK